MPSTAYNKDDHVEDESHQVVSSYFLGPKAENFEWFKKILIEVLEAQRDARLDYFPRDGKAIPEETQLSAAYRKSVKKMTEAIRQTATLLAKHSVPFWSPRYQGHMCMDMAMPALIGYFMTMIYNPNNVSIEASPLTTVAELQVGEDLCQLFGYNVDKNKKPLAWGHITCDGTIANLESMWVARNLKFYPLAIRYAMNDGEDLAFIRDIFEVPTCQGPPKLLYKMDRWDLLNIRPGDVLDIPERLYNEHYISPSFLNDVMKKYGIQSTSKGKLEKEYDVGEMKYFLSNTKHYSWPKSGAITGIGSDNIIGITVDRGARVDLADLKSKLQNCLDNKIGVYAVVAIIGSTEEGAVDPLSAILKIREDFQKQGLSFLVHGDGAWGGYFCTMLPKQYMPGDEPLLPSEGGAIEGFVPDAGLKTQTAEDLFALRFADSVTVDPHKAAYIPYPAGGLCYRDGRMRYLVTWTSPYISRGETTETSIGVFGVEGSKPGASVMSTWLANTCIGLGPDGYGKLLGEVTFTCSRLAAEWAAMTDETEDFKVLPLNQLPAELVEGTNDNLVKEQRDFIRENILQKSNLEIMREDENRPYEKKAMKLLREIGSDLNINAFSANWKYENGDWNTDVEEANYFNQLVIQDLSVDSPEDEPTEIPFYLTSTTFMIHEYGECAQHFKKRLGLIEDDTDLVVMRNVVMSPWPTDGNFVNSLITEYKKVMQKHVITCRKRNDMSAEKHEFLLQGTDKIYAVHFPMFNLAKHRKQLIFEIKLPEDTRKIYQSEREKNPEAIFSLKSMEDILLDQVIEKRQGFKGVLGQRAHAPSHANSDTEIQIFREIATDVPVEIGGVVKARSLQAQYRDRKYPASFVPFYLYGTKTSLNIDHVLVRSPNISLSADNITLESGLLDKIPEDELARGCILSINNLSEAAMQPFQSTEGELSSTLGKESQFFFTPGNTFDVTVYEDPRPGGISGPGLVDIHSEHEHGAESASATHGHATNGATNGDVGVGGGPLKLTFKELGSGKMTLGKGRYVDSVHINEDPFHIPEGTEKYKKWKQVFMSIGKEAGY